MRVLPPITPDLSLWAENLRRFLGRALNQLDAKQPGASAAEDGVLLYDKEFGYPIVSKANSFKALVVRETAPTTSVGAAGDLTGMIAWDTGYIYVCVGAHDGSAHIWKRVSMTGGSW